MPYSVSADEQTLIGFWDQTFSSQVKDQSSIDPKAPDSDRNLAPSDQLFQAAASLGRKKKVLDYGCGRAWAALIAARNGCMDVTAVDPAGGAINSARSVIALYGVEQQVNAFQISSDWLRTVQDCTYDGLICSNVLDVIPPERAQEIIRQSARIVTEDADLFFGLNYYLSPETAASKGMSLSEGNRLYLDGVLRLVSRTDAEWTSLFAPWFTVETLEHFAWPGEKEARRRLFHLRKKQPA